MPRVAQGLKRSRRDMQVIAYFVPRQVAFAQHRGTVVVHRLLQRPFRFPYPRESRFHFLAVII